jgi:hypothetical protein
MAFFHWNIHGKKSYIYTIQNAILSSCLFKIAFFIGDVLTNAISTYLSKEPKPTKWGH